MSMIALRKINRFYFIFILLLVLMAGLVIVSFRGIFSAIATSRDIDVDIPKEEIRIDKNNLNKAYEEYQNREFIPLNLQ
jgi:hypothetical protein